MKSKIVRNSSWLIGGRVIGDALSFVFYIALARKFDAGGIGDYALAFSLASLLGLVIEFGFNNLLTREISRDEKIAQKYFSNLPLIQFILMLFSGGIIYLFAYWSGYSANLTLMVYFAFLAFVFKAFGVAFTSYLVAIQVMSKASMLELVARFVSVFLGFGLLYSGASLTTIMISHAVGYLIFLLLSIIMVKKYFKTFNFEFDINFTIKTFRAALPFAAALLLYELYSRLDIIMLHNLAGEEETGIYAVTVRIITTLLFIPAMVGVAVYPVLSKSSSSDPVYAGKLFYSLLKWLGISGLVIAIVLATTGDEILIYLFKEKFEKSGELIRWMSILVVISFIKAPYYRLLFSMNREDLQVKIQGLSVLINVLLNFLLIPYWGALGAGIASIISELMMAITFHFYITKYITINLNGLYLKFITISATSLFIGLILRPYLHWFFLTVLVLVVYITISFLIKLITKQDLKFFDLIVKKVPI
jgi:O-antigen/teichoic acid export membrane protein